MWMIIRNTMQQFYESLRNLYFHFSHLFVVPLRYQVEIKGAEYIKEGKKGVLFLSNHTSHIDATILTVELLKLHCPISIWALDKTFRLPYLRWAARHSKTVKVVKVPNINEIRSAKHASRLHKLISRTGDGLKRGNNFLVFPAGCCKTTPVETISGKSAIPLILQQCPEVPIILVRMTGLWGSRFSIATKKESRWSTETIQFGHMLWKSMKMILLNGFFFIPKRKILIEFEPAGSDFPRGGSRLEIDRYLNKWFNAGWGPSGEPLQRVPDYFWKESSIEHEYTTKHYVYNLSQVAKPIRNAVVHLIADKADLDCKDISFEMQLGSDLGLDSLDQVEILTEIENQFGIKTMVPEEITTVGHLIAVAAKIPILCEIRKGRFHEIEHNPPLLSRVKRMFTNC